MPYHRPAFTTTATAATAGVGIFGIWNGLGSGAGARSLILKEFGLFATGAPGSGAGFVFRRATARGTASATTTPTIEHHDGRLYAPVSAFVVDTGYSAQPTLAAGELSPKYWFGTVAGSGIIYPFGDGLWIPPGQGLICVTRGAVIVPACDGHVVVDEG